MRILMTLRALSLINYSLNKLWTVDTLMKRSEDQSYKTSEAWS